MKDAKKLQNGFTLIELMVVISMIALIAGAVIANYAGTRSARSLRIASNELVTNIRKVQSYTLSSREINGGTAVQYYVLRFDPTATSASGNNIYTIQAMYDTQTVPPQLRNLEVVSLPTGVSIGATSVNGTSSNCLLVAFELPFSRVLANSLCTGSPPNVIDTDDYKQIINFVTNNINTTVTSDSVNVITLRNRSGQTAKVLVNGVTGVVCPTADGLTCLASY